MTIAFAYFTKSEVLLSIWVFHLLTVLQVGILTRFGLDMGASDPYTSYHPAVGWQSFGSLIVFVFWGLWVARNHLTAVVRKAFVGDDSVETDRSRLPAPPPHRTGLCLAPVRQQRNRSGERHGPRSLRRCEDPGHHDPGPHPPTWSGRRTSKRKLLPAAACVGIAVDAIWFPGQGHKIHGW